MGEQRVDPLVSIALLSMAFISEVLGQTSHIPVRRHTDVPPKRCIFGPIGDGASSVVQIAISIPLHRIFGLIKINIFDKVHFLMSEMQLTATLLRTSVFLFCFHEHPNMVVFIFSPLIIVRSTSLN